MSHEWHQVRLLVLLNLYLIIKLTLVATKKQTQIELRELGSQRGTHLLYEVVEPEHSKGSMRYCYQGKQKSDCSFRQCNYPKESQILRKENLQNSRPSSSSSQMKSSTWFSSGSHPISLGMSPASVGTGRRWWRWALGPRRGPHGKRGMQVGFGSAQGYEELWGLFC